MYRSLIELPKNCLQLGDRCVETTGTIFLWKKLEKNDFILVHNTRGMFQTAMKNISLRLLTQTLNFTRFITSTPIVG
jgi:hypothetical protein